ncbi:MAG: UDP-N-acetylmuramoyl-L-alanine--D-glutamate ligase [Candidatus Abyssobacteria bacterium SURF_17]|uniref:UDP-N-acetylmuramoylalanine--D-glutamate ligase n=1 Tax=Candidatus Abyssobacteria bacterium SURF_17 TaxID=2093361 RepID=A0A419F7P2_9BACT|nr:MAG: UDP-N-acetylmuramoyl-L-alanine--D-glutamate ligase [Candidatus Abyssubacteria bacterium SURF_17]
MLELSGKRVAVVGMGLSGVAAARMLRRQGSHVVLTDDKTADELKDEMKALVEMNVEYHLGGIEAKVLLDSDLVILSPGVPSDLPQIERARRAGLEVISEIELAYSMCKAPIIAITGTNGKTTTTMLTHHIATHAGLKAGLAGNVEIPFSEIVSEGPFDVMVLEVSSFQLENIKDFRPHVGALLNISPDHLDRYQRLDDYVAAKFLLFENQSNNEFAVLNEDDAAVVQVAERIPSRVLRFSMKTEVEQGAFLRNEHLVVRFDGNESRVMSVSGIPLFGRHNVENVLAAIAATLPLKVPVECYAPAVASFPGVEHRLERVREMDGVLFVNDSKATNIGATEKALESFDRPIVLIAGGRGKKSPYQPLRPLVKNKVRALVVIGEDAALLEDAFGDLVPTRRADTLPEAVRHAASLARSGDCVLLAPACASFDMFRNYKHRGRVFKEAVNAL